MKRPYPFAMALCACGIAIVPTGPAQDEVAAAPASIAQLKFSIGHVQADVSGGFGLHKEGVTVPLIAAVPEQLVAALGQAGFQIAGPGAPADVVLNVRIASDATSNWGTNDYDLASQVVVQLSGASGVSPVPLSCSVPLRTGEGSLHDPSIQAHAHRIAVCVTNVLSRSPATARLAESLHPVVHAPEPTPAAVPKLLAVLPLDLRHAKGKMDADAQASVEEMLRDVATDNLTSAGWTVLTGDTMLQVLRDNGVDPTKCGDEECHLSSARELNVTKFISGAVEYVDGQFTASIRLIDTKSGRILAAQRASGATATDLRRAFEAKAAEFFQKAGVVPPAP